MDEQLSEIKSLIEGLVSSNATSRQTEADVAVPSEEVAPVDTGVGKIT